MKTTLLSTSLVPELSASNKVDILNIASEIPQSDDQNKIQQAFTANSSTDNKYASISIYYM